MSVRLPPAAPVRPWSLPPRKRESTSRSFDPWGVVKAGAGVAGELAGLVESRKIRSETKNQKTTMIMKLKYK